ncbi:hypothetical protein L596_013065 [Steinernema carpocapsae]|uniref:t-SNARE coiled-coil homology domain-containing protein n=1 Tax=Steinernema carpocapsae TaxID=34508 RepID=A0A4U5NZW6_STECR|nr:hypothetical protein L596_013065 [Steinernema carpocapsae]
MRMTMTMSDAERNAFDAETDIAMKECSKGIIKLQKAIKSDPNIRAVDESKHLNHACDLLDMYLNSIRQIIAQMRTVRLYKTKSRQVVSRLSNLVKLHESSITSETKSEIPKAKEESDGWEHVNSQDESRSRKSWNPVQIKREAEEPLLSHEPHLHQVKPDQCFFQQELTRSAFAEPETDFTEVEELKFAMENQQLRRRLQHTNTEVEAIEKQVEELHRMQKFFSEKVMDQEVDIIKVHTAAEETVENIKDGNDLIRSAIKNGASRRVIFLFCLIVLTFTLLFLDWYNP